VERQAVKFWSKATFSTVNPVEHKDWNADGIFSKSAVVVAVKPAAAAAGGVSTAVAPAHDCSVLAASVLSDVLQTGDEAQVGYSSIMLYFSCPCYCSSMFTPLFFTVTIALR